VLMYDSARNVPSLPSAEAYAAYVNADFATNKDEVVKRFPKARVFGIDVLGDDWDIASIFDFEPGNAVFDPDKLKMAVTRRENFRPHTSVVYCDRDNLAAAEAALSGLWYMVWLSTLDGTIITGQKTANGSLIVATQYKGGETALYDTSQVLEQWVYGTLLP
jgi:hypothetical protein